MNTLAGLRIVEVEGVKGSVKIAFRGVRPLPLIYIHGSGLDGSLWWRQLKEVGGYAVDLPGHGLSDEVSVKTVNDYAFYVAKAAEKLVGKAFFAGHSLGGAIAQSLYLNFKEVVSGLILIGTGARLRVLPQILEGLRSRPKETINMFIDYAFGVKEGLENLIEEAEKLLFERRELLLKDLSICDRFDLLEDYRAGRIKVNVPTLIIVGELDRLTPVKYSHFLHSTITGSKLTVIREAGHMVMLEKPDEFNEALSSFIAEQKLKPV
ncbi:MAG: alpha/beta hydrolase [Candidatus Nezhaarchaeales archaeon]